MKLRAPAYPLITVDPYFNVWSHSDILTDSDPVHWTDKPNTISAVATVDGAQYRVMGVKDAASIPAMKQVSVDVSTFSTTYVFEGNGVRLTLIFTSPILPNDLYLLSRPVSYLEVRQDSLDGRKHTVSLKVSASEELCMNLRGDDAVECEEIALGKLNTVKMGTKSQKILSRIGDDLRIEWGYFYLTAEGTTSVTTEDGMTFVNVDTPVKKSALITFAYDDLYSIDHESVKYILPTDKEIKE